MLIESYSETNQNYQNALYSGSLTKAGQSFEGKNHRITDVVFYIRKSGSPTGNVTAEIYAHTGSFGSGGTATGSALATSNTVDVAGLTTSFALNRFSFATPFVATRGTYYCIVLSYSGGDSSNKLEYGFDDTSPTHNGNLVEYNGSWAGWSSTDVCFKLYGNTFDYGGALVQIASDNFNRADSASLGSNWTDCNGDDGNPHALKTVSNQVKVTDTGVDNISRRTGETYSSDQFSSIEISALGADSHAGAGVRFGADNGYICQVRKASNVVRITRKTGTTYTTLTEDSLTINSGDIITAVAISSTIFIFVNNKIINKVVDTTYATGSPSINADHADDILDNWVGGDVRNLKIKGVSSIKGISSLKPNA